MKFLSTTAPPRTTLLTLSQQPPAFSILDRSGGDFEIVGPRTALRRGALERLERLLSSAREQHSKLSDLIDEVDRPAWHGRALEVHRMKKQRLHYKDRISALLGAVRRERPWALASGSYGKVLLGRSLQGDGEPVAIKLGWRGTSLAHEAAVLSALTAAKARGFPAFRHHGKQRVEGEPSEVLAMELLGPSVDELWWASSCAAAPLSAGCVLRIGLEVLECLQRLHGVGYTHNDLKPSNFCVGLDDANAIYLCDLGSATPWKGDDDDDDDDDETPTLRGRPIFASAAAHVRRRTEPSDDLESLCYVLRYLLVGSLPWEALEASMRRDDVAAEVHDACLVERPTMAYCPTDALAAAKRDVDAASLTAGLPDEAAAALKGLWAARVGADYAAGAAALRAGIENLAGREGTEHDWVRLGLSWSAGGDIRDADGAVLHAASGDD